MIIRILFLALIIFTTNTINGQEKKDSYTDLITKIDAIVSENNFNGVVSITNDSSNIYSKVFGYSDLKAKTPLQFDDQFVIGSVSKQITAVLVLREFEKNTLTLHDTINKYLTGIKQPWAKEVTIHQLLTHTHGIVAVDKPLEFKQGSQFHYSQLGYELLAQILQKVTKQTFQQLSKNLFQEIGMNNTFHPKNKKYKHLVKGYEENENGHLIFANNSLENYVPAGSFISNATDLKQWNQKLHAGQIVSPETLKLMSTRYATRIHPIFETVEYGYGLLFKNGEENIQIGALGYAAGFVTACYYYPKSKINVIVLQNTAKHLDDFKQTFKVHTEIMDLIKNDSEISK